MAPCAKMDHLPLAWAPVGDVVCRTAFEAVGTWMRRDGKRFRDSRCLLRQARCKRAIAATSRNTHGAVDWESFRLEQWDQMRHNLDGDWRGPIEKLTFPAGEGGMVHVSEHGQAHYIVRFAADGKTGLWEGKRLLEQGRPSEYRIPLSRANFNPAKGIFNFKGISGQYGVTPTGEFVIETNFLGSDHTRRMIILRWRASDEPGRPPLQAVTWCGFRNFDATDWVPVVNRQSPPVEELIDWLAQNPEPTIIQALAASSGTLQPVSLSHPEVMTAAQLAEMTVTMINDGLFIAVCGTSSEANWHFVLGRCHPRRDSLHLLHVAVAGRRPTRLSSTLFGQVGSIR
ncbi:hypothetical protein FVE85_2208 [Porphyridium purpureum]|uniref:DUF3598 domain-containing protein n=1 Tax=Porphyridium purpureum TaxID=35688 RepID=A0A5J4YZP9_PORPP|nr:hypothetical protein FVE85_2208 [Porphyridium purpureum]|eukprot:POR2071..scf209_3